MLTDRQSDRMTLVIDADKCTGCNTCMLVCSFIHDKVFSYERSRIRVWHDTAHAVFKPTLCEHCKDAPCISVCPTGALYRDETGRVLQNADRCIGCKECMNACPFGAISFNSDQEMIKCDLCASVGGTPYCAQYCTAGALQWIPERLVARKKVRDAVLQKVKAGVAEGGE